MKFTISFLIAISSLVNIYAQSIGVGEWKDYLPYNNSISVVKMGDRIYTATENSLFFLEINEGTISRLNTTTGLSDAGISCMEKSPENDQIIVAYKSTVIDIINGDEIYSLSDIERENIIGEKKINAISFFDGKAYLSSSFGIIELDPIKKEISNTFYLNASSTLGVTDVVFKGDYIYAATDLGIFNANLSDNLSDYNNWVLIAEETDINDLEIAFEKLYFTKNNTDSIFVFEDEIRFVTEVENLKFIEAEGGQLFVGSRSMLSRLNESDGLTTLAESSLMYFISDIISDGDVYWIAEKSKSLVRLSNEGRFQAFTPQGPRSNLAYSVTISREKLFLSPGGTSIIWDNNNTYQGFYWFDG